MKPLHTILISGLMGAALSSIGIAGYLVWHSLATAPTPIATSTPVASAPPELPSPTPSAAAATEVAAPVAPVAPAAPAVTLTQQENDYLYDLSQSLQSPELRRVNVAGKLAIGRKIQGWLDSGADYWGVRAKFDAEYKGVVAGSYAFNRDSYIKAATERFAPSRLATLTQPAPEPIVITRTEYVPQPQKEEATQPEVVREVETRYVPVPRPVPFPFPGHRPHYPRPGHSDHDSGHSDQGSDHDGDTAESPTQPGDADHHSGDTAGPSPNQADQSSDLANSQPTPRPPRLPQSDDHLPNPPQPGGFRPEGVLAERR